MLRPGNVLFLGQSSLALREPGHLTSGRTVEVRAAQKLCLIFKELAEREAAG